MPRILRHILIVLLILVAAMFATGFAFALVDRGVVVTNTSVAGREVGGYATGRLRTEVEGIAREFARDRLRMRTPSGEVEATFGQLGVLVDVDATVDDVMAAGRSLAAALRPLEALDARVSQRDVPLRLTADEDAVQRALLAIPDAVVSPPTLPGFQVEDGQLVAVPGDPGRGVVAADVLQRVRRTFRPDVDPLVIDVGFGQVPPALGVEASEELLPTAREITAATLRVAAHGYEADLAPERLRTWVRTVPGPDGGVALALDEDQVLADVVAVLAPAGTGPGGARYEVVEAPVRTQAGQIFDGGAVNPLPPQGGTICCSPEVASVVWDVLSNRSGSGDGDGSGGDEDEGTDIEPVEVPLRGATEAEMAADQAGLGIVELVGGFTTAHSCCQARVANIHRIADITQLHVIRPGQTFSLNDFVGPRTREKGFVSAGVIVNGRFEESVGGGISQFATTLFNAAFFSGLDYGEYQSHSIYISRYPRGREATVSWPHPDLEIVNTTPYGILLHTQYTDTTISVSMYSARHVTVEAGEPTSTRVNQCTRWTTPRTRTYADGEIVEDSVFAVYRPSEGRDCNGNPT